MRYLIFNTKNRIKRKMSDVRGMTMAEVLIVIAIIGVLAAVAFLSVSAHQRSMAQLERDNIAKEIFVAAQNHLTMAKGAGYLGDSTKYGTAGNDTEADPENKEDIFYFTVNKGTVGNNGDDIFEIMLPFGSIDETIRGGGNYLIRYQRKSAQVLDVFYCSTSGSPSVFNYDENLTYSDMMALKAAEDPKAAMKDWNGHVVGWYGAEEAGELVTAEIKAPSIEVKNEEKLYVIVNDVESNKEIIDADGNPCVSLKLLLKGEVSNCEGTITIYDGSTPTNTAIINTAVTNRNPYWIVLDDITQTSFANVNRGTINTGQHFCNLIFDQGFDNMFIPGENITVQAVASSTAIFANVAYSNKVTTNSLFADGSTYKVNKGTDIVTTAKINNIRHLENLDYVISGFDGSASTKVQALQTDNMSWPEFILGINWINNTGSVSGTPKIDEVPIDIFDSERNNTVSGDTGKNYYYPINLDYTMEYNGQNHSISGVVTNWDGPAGIFGTIIDNDNTVEIIENLELIDFNITGTTGAGTLAGINANDELVVTNVAAKNSKTNDKSFSIAAPNVTASGAAGGLIGNGGSGTIDACGAAVYVNSTAGDAGGLLGASSGEITRSYSGGHTEKGEYYKHSTDSTTGTVTKTPLYNIIGSTTAGGLVGSYSGTKIENSYSTCSVSGNIAGGFVGSISGNNRIIKNCYCTGLVSGNENNAFIGGGVPKLEDTNYYYEIINETKDADGKIGYKQSGIVNESENEHIKKLDENVDTYNAFVGAYSSDASNNTWDSANAYDSDIIKYYSGKYTLRTVLQLPATVAKRSVAKEDANKTLFAKTHYGDWPAPEIFVINTQGS